MRKIGKESTSPVESGDSRDSSDKGWLRRHWCSVSLGVIVIAALLLRTIFAYGTSLEGDFALSGGSSGQFHLHVIESILGGTYAIGIDAAVNYPIGGLNVDPPLLDFLAAGVASVLSMTGLGTTEAASAALAGINPIIGAITCIPVYLVAKEMFDKRIGVVAALIYAFLALPISTAVFSNGTGYALAAFFVAFMSLFLVKTAKALDSNENGKGVLKNGILTGLFLGLAALSWNGFGVLIAVIAALMILQAVTDRFRGVKISTALVPYALAIIIGIAISAVYYIPAGLFDAVFSGPLILGVLSVVFALVFMVLKSKPWIIVIPALILAFVAILIVLYFAVPDLFTALVVGGTAYAEGMAHLITNRVSMSNVSSYYGWVTMWLPVCLALYESYVFLRKERSSTHLMAAVWLFMMFFAVWSSYENAAVVGVVFATGSAAAIVMVLQMAKLKDWVKSIKSAGFPSGFKKFVKPLPLASVLITICLIAVPGATSALDAGVPVNDSDSPFYNGNTQFVIKAGDSYPVEKIWSNIEKPDSALVSWIDHVYDAVNDAGFKTVVDTRGDGTSALSHILLSEGSAGAVAGMALRLMMSNNVDDYASYFPSTESFEKVKGYINNPASAKAEIKANPDIYGSVSSDLSDVNAVNLVCIEYMVKEIGLVGICDLYDKMCSGTGEKIGYILLDPSMLPLQSGASTNFSSIATMGGYKTDSNGAVPEFFTYMSYFGYTTYTDAMYDTFLWKAMIGPSATEAGSSSSYSYLYDLSSSDGSDDSVVVSPEGIAGFESVSWIIQYNPDKTATGTSEGWEYMEYDEAMKLQKTQGGVVNYLSSYILYKYVGLEATSGTITGKVDATSGDVDGMEVEVLKFNDHLERYTVYSSGVINNGAYSVAVPHEGDYKVSLKSGSVVVASFEKGEVPQTITVNPVTVGGSLLVGDLQYDGPFAKVVMKNKATGEKKTITNIYKDYKAENILPGEYQVDVYDRAGTSLASVTLAVIENTETLNISLTVKKITATVEDVNDNKIEDGKVEVYATNVDTGERYHAPTKDGVAVIPVIAGTYTMSLEGDYISIMSTTQNASSSDKSVTIVAHEKVSVEVESGLNVYSGVYSSVSKEGSVDLPISIATQSSFYTVYGVKDGQIVIGTIIDGVVSTQAYDMATVTGKLSKGNASISFIMESGAMINAVADDEGKFTAYIPKGVPCSVYATDKSSLVYFAKISSTSDNDMGEITLADGRKITNTLRYSSGTSNGSIELGFVKTDITFTYEEKEYKINGMTNTSGQTVFYIPDNVEATLTYNGGTLESELFSCKDLKQSIASGTSNSTNSKTIDLYDENDKDQDNYVKQVQVTVPYKIVLDPYSKGDDVTLEPNVATTLNPGQYTAKITEGGYFFDGKVYLYPGATEFVGLEPYKAYKVNVKSGTGDVITVTSEGKYNNVEDTYFLEEGYDYLFKSVKGTGDEMLVKYAVFKSDSTSTDLDVTADSKVMTISGFIGVVADGTLTITSGDVKFTAAIKDGQYSAEVPESMTSANFAVEASKVVDDKIEYKYTGNIDVSNLKDGEYRNVPVYGDGSDYVKDDATFTANIVSAEFSNGIATVTVDIKNLSKFATQFTINSGAAWCLDNTYSVSVDKESTGTFIVKGHYDVNQVSAGSKGVTLEVTDVAKQATKSLPIDMNSASGTYGTLDILKAGEEGATIDRISAGEYMYAITFTNNGTATYNVSLDASIKVSGWNISLVDSSGKVIKSNNSTFQIFGHETTVIYVKVMILQTSEDNKAPDVSVAITYENDGYKTLSMTPVDVDVELDSAEATGENIFNERSEVPLGIWFMLALSVLMLVALFWLGSKRGVFSRKK